MHSLWTFVRYQQELQNAPQLQKFDLTVSQFNLLYCLHENPGIGPTALSRKMGCDKSNVTRLVRRMETEGLISLHKSTSDHRLDHLEITKEGKALFQKAQNTFETQIANRIRKLEVDERRLLIERLRSLFDLLKNESTSKHAKGLMIGCNRRISK